MSIIDRVKSRGKLVMAAFMASGATACQDITVKPQPSPNRPGGGNIGWREDMAPQHDQNIPQLHDFDDKGGLKKPALQTPAP